MSGAAADYAAIPLLKSLGPLEALDWTGAAETVSVFEAVLPRGKRRLATAYFVPPSDDLIWKACLEMLGNAMKMAAVGLQGFYGFQMLAMELEGGIEQFRFGDVTKLLVNHARGMRTGESRLIQYGGLFGVFKKRVAEEWGKVDFKSCVSVERRGKEKLDLALKAFARAAGAGADGLILTVCDLGAERFYDPEHAEQAARLCAWREKLKQDNGGLEQILYRHQGKNVTLWPC